MKWIKDFTKLPDEEVLAITADKKIVRGKIEKGHSGSLYCGGLLFEAYVPISDVLADYEDDGAPLDYELEVKKVYPEAYVSWFYSEEIDDIIIYGIYPVYTDGDFRNEHEAWKSAWETIQKKEPNK